MACHDSGERGRDAAEKEIRANGYTIVTEELTMIVNGKRIRADFVTRDPQGKLVIFEVKNGTGRLTKNQSAAGVFDMDRPANKQGGGGKGTQATFTVATSNPEKTTKVHLPAKGNTETATFAVLKYDV